MSGNNSNAQLGQDLPPEQSGTPTNAETNQLARDLRSLSKDLTNTATALGLAKKPLDLLSKFIKSPKKIEEQIAKTKDQLDKAQKIFLTLDKVSFLRPLTKVVKPVIKILIDRTGELLTAQAKLSKASLKYGDKIEKAKEVLEKLSEGAALGAGGAGKLADRVAGIDSNLSGVKDSAQEVRDAFGFGGTPAGQPQNDESAPPIAGINVEEELAFADGIDGMFDLLSERAGAASEVVTALAAPLEPISAAVEALEELIDSPVFALLEKLGNAVETLADTLASVFGPLGTVYDYARPVIDALDSVFGFILKPLEYALEAVVNATGIGSLLEALAEEFLGLLPNIDLGIIEAIDEQMAQLFDVDFPRLFDLEIENPLQGIFDELNLGDFPPSVSLSTNQDDVILGEFAFFAPQSTDARDGNDLLVGGSFNDALSGGSGADTLIGGPGDDLLEGGDNPADRPDIVIYKGSIDDYGIASILTDDGFASGTWIVADYRGDENLGGEVRYNAGTDTLVGIEQIVFDDYVVPIGRIDTFIRTMSRDGEFARVTPSDTTLNPVGGVPQVTADGGIDWIFGGLGFDVFVTAGGNDQLISVGNGPLTIQVQRAAGDWLDGGDGNDLFLIDSNSARFDLILGGPGEDSVNYRESTTGLAVFLAAGGDAERYRPSSVAIDVDYLGKSQPGLDYLIGYIRDVENIEGTNFGDYFWGTDGSNKINGGDGNDQIRGLGGDDILHGGDGNDILVGDGGNDVLYGGAGSNEYIAGLGDDVIIDISGDFSIVKYSVFADTDHYTQNVNFVDFATTGVSELTPWDMPGGIVIFPGLSPSIQQVSKYATSVIDGDRYGVDYLDGIDRIVASIGDDIIYAAFEQDQTIYGNDGDDRLFSGGGNSDSTFFGGPGNDSFVSGSTNEDTFFGGEDDDIVTISGDTSIDGDLYFGGDNRVGSLPGIDTLDFSGSDYAWHIYLNPASGSGSAEGKSFQSIADAEDPRYIQPTLGVNGVVERQPGGSNSDGENPEVLLDLRKPDPNTPDPGGRTDRIGEWDIFLGSGNRDIFTLGSPDGAITAYGNGGDDVLFGQQQFGDQLYGGSGDDILGTLNPEYSSDGNSSLFNPFEVALLDGGEGDDLFVAGDFLEDIRGGGGIDELTFEASREGVTADLETGQLRGGHARGDIMSGIEYLTGSFFDDVLRGDDQLNQLLGWEGDDELHGRGGEDILYGDEGDDLLLGGDGNDLLHGGNGSDTLNGGDGFDTASWNLYQIHPKGGANRLTNDLSGIEVDLLAGTTADGDVIIDIENVLGSAGDDKLFGDDLDNVLTGDLGDDLLDGRDGDDVLIGGEGDDTVRGGDGDDWLGGGAGSNSIEGGAGNDTIDYGTLEYGITVEMAGVGSRTGLGTGIVSSLVPVDFFVWKDSLTETIGPSGEPGDVIETGTDEVRYTFRRNDQGTDDPSDDTFFQEDPITPERIWRLDPFFAEKPSDLNDVRSLPDVLLPEQEVARVERFEAATDVFQGVETIAGGQGDDRFLGNGEDTVFYGGLGADTIDGGAGSDTASYEFSESAVTIDLSSGLAGGGDAAGDVLQNIENVIGSAHADALTGNDRDSRLTLGAGNDSARGGAGTDTVVLEFVRAAAIIQFYASGLRIVQADGLDTLSIDFVEDDIEFFEFSDGTFTYAELAATVITGTGASETIIGTQVADPIEGKGGNDRIEGREDHDTLDGGSGNDTLVGESGNDRLIGGDDADRFEGGTGDDTYVVDSALEITLELFDEGIDTVESPVSLTLQANVENLQLLGTANADGAGNELDNQLTGNSGANTLTGFLGADTLDGGAGGDRLIGGPGDDHYTVDHPDDIVEESPGEGTDTVASFVDFTLGANLENLEVLGTAGITALGNQRDNRIVDSDGDNTLDGRFGFDTAVFSFALADASFDYADGAFLITSAAGTDRLLNIEAVQFADQLLSMDELVNIAYPHQDVGLFAGDRYETDYPIDMTPQGGGKQFIFFDTRNQDNSQQNRYFFETEFLNGRGKAYFEGSNIRNPQDATANSMRVDFSGGNTTQLSVDGFAIPLLTMLDASWDFYQIAIFGGDDRITGSYYDDKLVGYRGDDIIFGGLGDKEGYNVEGSTPSNRPSTLRNPGDAVSNPAFWVDDGDDLIDGAEGDDLLDGGTGNDTLLGGAGNDQLWGGGDNGSDRLDGGEGDDTSTGGAGSDVFVLTPYMGHDVITDFQQGADSLDTAALDSAGSQANLTIVGANTVITLDDGSSLTLLGVQARLAGFNTAATGGVAIAGVVEAGATLQAQAVDVADEDGLGSFTYQWLRDGEEIDGASGSSYTTSSADVGRGLAVRLRFTDGGGSVETLTSAYTAPVAAAIGDQVILGSDIGEDLPGDVGDDNISGGGGNDLITGGPGNDTIDGGPGHDTAVFSGPQSSYTIVLSDSGITVTDRRADGDGTDYLQSIESLDFNPELPNFRGSPVLIEKYSGPANLTEDEFFSLTELYLAYFNRAPDALGLFFWGTRLAAGMDLVTISRSFFEVSETRARYPDPEDYPTFVEAVYNNVLGRSPDPGGFAFWVGQLENNPNVGPGNFILAILNGARAPTSGPKDRAYLAAKTELGSYFSVVKGMTSNARDALDAFDGSAESIAATIATIDALYENAIDPDNGEFLIQIAGRSDTENDFSAT